MGSWGGGIALAFKQKFPSAYETYHKHCLSYSDDPRRLMGTCLIIRGASEKYDIGCLFTSVGYGKHVDPPSMILDATRKAVKDLMEQNSGDHAKAIHSCQFNSGLFRVPWEDSQKVLEEEGASMVVYLPPE